MILGTYRKITQEDMTHLADRHWTGWEPDNADNPIIFEGVIWNIPGHPEPIIITYQKRADEDDIMWTLAYTHIPYPHRLLPDTRKRIGSLIMWANKDEFMEKIEELALESSE